MKSEKAKKKTIEKNRNDVILYLPRFINQLLLLLNSGVVLDDAFRRVAMSGTAEDHRNYLSQGIYEICENAGKNGESPINAFYRFARRSNIKELTRVANILMECRHKGTDIWDKLEYQGDNLWKERKLAGMEKIRVSESRMSFPLALMLIALILITAAPAFLSMGT